MAGKIRWTIIALVFIGVAVKAIAWIYAQSPAETPPMPRVVTPATEAPTAPLPAAASDQAGQGSLLVHLSSTEAKAPAEFVLTDPQGRRTGKTGRGGQGYAQIPRATYGTHQEITDPAAEEQALKEGRTIQSGEYQELELMSPLDGEYTLTVVGTKGGPYTIDLIGFDRGNRDTKVSLTGTITKGGSQTYTFSYSGNTGEAIRIVPKSTAVQ